MGRTPNPMLAEAMETQATVQGRCPSCGQHTHFVYLGEQRWPARVVEKTGMPPVTYLWTCGSCQSTISQQEIRD